MTFPARLATLAAFAVLIGGCAPDPVQWDDTLQTTSSWGAIALDASGKVAAVPATDSTVANGLSAAGACAGSLVYARAGARRFAVWWQPRADGSAVLTAARADANAAWSSPIPVDTTDATRLGCTRPAPSVAGDSATGNLYIGYWASPPLGAGVYAVHWMDGMFHATVPVEFGDHPVHTAVAVSGHVVIVAYESPNGTRQQITMAISHTDGHIFDAHVLGAGEDLPATMPALALDGHRVALAYTEAAGGNGTAPSVRRVVRTGRVR